MFKVYDNCGCEKKKKKKAILQIGSMMAFASA